MSRPRVEVLKICPRCSGGNYPHTLTRELVVQFLIPLSDKLITFANYSVAQTKLMLYFDNVL